MLFVLITSAKVVQKAKTHYTINNICSTILINHKLFVHLLHEIRESPPRTYTSSFQQNGMWCIFQHQY